MPENVINKKIIILFSLWSLIATCNYKASAQQYSIKYIHEKADSAIRANVGNRIPIKYRMWTYLLGYQYTKGKSKRIKHGNWHKLETSDITKGNFQSAEIKYHIYFRDEHDVGWKSFGLPEEIIHLDAAFNLTDSVKISRGIPQYILNEDTTKFITYQQAIRLVHNQFTFSWDSKEGREHYQKLTLIPYLIIRPEPFVEYDTKLMVEKTLRRHHWQIRQIIHCAELGGYIESIDDATMKKYGEIYNTKDLERIFYIDAITREIIYQGSLHETNASYM